MDERVTGFPAVAPRTVGPAVLDLRGFTAIVTGGSRGIGAGIAAALTASGVTVTILGRGVPSGEATAARLTEIGPGECVFRACDVSDRSTLADVITSEVQRLGRLDILVNNAVRYPGLGPIDAVPDSLVDSVMQANIGAYLAACRVALPALRQVRGSIVNVGSITGTIGGWHDALYAASKSAIMAFTQSLAIEEAAHGVRVNALLPGNIMSDARIRAESKVARRGEFHSFVESWQWAGRSGTIEEAGNAALFLASPMSSFCTGIGLVVSGGLELGYGPKGPYPDFDVQDDPA